MALSDTLARIPFLGGYLGAQEVDQQQALRRAQVTGANLSLADKVRAMQQQQEFQAAIASGADPYETALKYAHPKDVVASGDRRAAIDAKRATDMARLQDVAIRSQQNYELAKRRAKTAEERLELDRQWKPFYAKIMRANLAIRSGQANYDYGITMPFMPQLPDEGGMPSTAPAPVPAPTAPAPTSPAVPQTQDWRSGGPAPSYALRTNAPDEQTALQMAHSLNAQGRPFNIQVDGGAPTTAPTAAPTAPIPASAPQPVASTAVPMGDKPPAYDPNLTPKDNAAIRRKWFETRASEGAKRTAKEVDKDIGRVQVSDALQKIFGSYTELANLGAVVSPSQNFAKNVVNRVANSWLGQYIAGYGGTEEQTLRDNIEQTRPLVVASMKKALGITGTEMNSNVELQFYLAAATDLTRGYESNVAAIVMLDKLAGSGEIYDELKNVVDPKVLTKMRVQAKKSALPPYTKRELPRGWNVEVINP